MNGPQNESSTDPRWDMLRQRARMLNELRAFFDAKGFLEVQPPCLSRCSIVDPYIDPIELPANELQLGSDLADRYYLQTSPELAMKRMLAAGSPSIYSMGPVFRAGELGDCHNAEFTMLEWYDVGAGESEGIALLGQLASQLLQTDGYDVVTYRRLFQDALGFDPVDGGLDVLRAEVETLDRSLARSLGDDRDGLLDVLLSERLQPMLGIDRPLIVRNYPLSQAALARVSEDDPKCAFRFELFVRGIELANGYDELTDAEVLEKRLRDNHHKRQVSGRKTVKGPDEALIRTISEKLPRCTGVALGVDRLLMVRMGKRTLREVLPFPIDLA